MRIRTLMMGLLTLAAAGAWPEASPAAPQGSGRIHSSLGFSFAPPRGKDWTEEFGNSRVEYLKKTDTAVATFYAGVVEVRLPEPLPDKKSLAAFVRAKKNEWGSDGRFTEVTASFLPEKHQSSCVRYRMTAHDRGAKNRGSYPFLVLRVVGRFCTHPWNPQTAVDIYYSTRHLPNYDTSAFDLEGDAFLDSLALEKPPAISGKSL